MRNFLLLAAALIPAASLSGQVQTWHYTSSFESSFNADHAGAALADLGDVDGDGYDDYAVGAPNAVQPIAQTRGAVYAYSGASGKLIWEVAGTFNDGRLGESVTAIGDLDGDGISEVLIGEPNGGNLITTGPGRALVVSGATGLTIRNHIGSTNKDRLGSAVAGIGDINSDGFPDYIVGAKGVDTGLLQDNGAVYVFDGASGIVLYQVNGTVDFAHFGASVAVLSDLNNDGKAEWVGGAPEAGILGVGPNVGYARVISGGNGAQLHFKQGTMAGDRFGFAVSGVGDLNSDGTDDFLVGAPHSATQFGLADRGAVFAYSGSTGALLSRLDGLAIQGRYGSAIAGVADRTGDGVAEILIGAPGIDRCEVRSGGNNFLVQSLFRPNGADDFGSAVCPTADFDGDGKEDLLVGSTGETVASDPGLVCIFRAEDLPEDFHWTKNSANSRWYGRTSDMDWADAKAAADAHSDVELVTVRDMAEQNFLWDTMLSGDGIAYIGLTDEAQEGNFVWRSGETTPWWAANNHFGVGNVPGNWYFQEPNNLNNEDAVTIGRPGVANPNGEWNDAQGVAARDALFEWEPPVLIQLTYAGSCPGSGPMTCTGLTPQSSAAVVYGFAGTTSASAGPCGVLQVPVSTPTLLFVSTASPLGSIQFNASLPPGACGNIDAVVLDLSSCQFSNLLSL